MIGADTGVRRSAKGGGTPVFESSEVRGELVGMPWFRPNVGTLVMTFEGPAKEWVEVLEFSGHVVISGPDGVRVRFRTPGGVDVVKVDTVASGGAREVVVKWRGGNGAGRVTVSVNGVEVKPGFDAHVCSFSEVRALSWGQSGDLSKVNLKYWPIRL